MEGPSRKEKLILRVMIALGVVSVCFFLYKLCRPQNIGYSPFYYPIMATFFFMCFKALHEWYHYFNISTPKLRKSVKSYTIDVFTTFCEGEPYSMIEETLEAIQKITTPHSTYLCDEANDPYLKEVCLRLGVNHVTRNNRIDAKAGNINNALKNSNGELCVVLDPDHVPKPNFLEKVIPYFQDREIGYVQIVQAYKNIKDSFIAKGAAQQTFQYYGPMMMCMNSYGTVQAIGANCTFRREALDSIGGHAAGLAEDMHTAMQMHAKGWKSVYVPEVLTRGLVPTTLSAYYKQQLKWSRGVFELLFSTYPKLFNKFSWRQKFHYATLPWYYFIGVIFMINFIIPILSLLSGEMPFRMDFVEFMIIGSPLFFSTILIRHYVQRWVMEETERGFHVVGGLLLIGTWWIHTLGLIYTVLRKKVPYVPTPKDNNEEDLIKLNIPNFIVLILSLTAFFYGFHRHTNLYHYMMGGMALANAFFMGFMILISMQYRMRTIIYNNPVLGFGARLIKQFRIGLWKLNHSIFYFMRAFALPLLVALCICGVYGIFKHQPDQKRLINEMELLSRTQNKENAWTTAWVKNQPATTNQPQLNFKILKPSVLLYKNTLATYSAITEINGVWNIATRSDSVKWSWYLVGLDARPEYNTVRFIGQGTKVDVKIPENYENYRIMLCVSTANHTRYAVAELNTYLPSLVLKE